jgi:hypothetical protein
VLIGCASENVREAYDRSLSASDGLVARTASTIVDRDKLFEHLRMVAGAGFALDLEECEPGLCCAAAPVHDAAGRMVAALSISGPAFRLGEERLLRTRDRAARRSPQWATPPLIGALRPRGHRKRARSAHRRRKRSAQRKPAGELNRAKFASEAGGSPACTSVSAPNRSRFRPPRGALRASRLRRSLPTTTARPNSRAR